MAGQRRITVDANEAVASVAYRTNEVIAIYPITPASPMGESADAWSAQGRPNLWGQVPEVVEMQSEGGAAGTAHGALQTGSLVTTFTASQGLLLMLPNLYKIAGELTPFVLHVAARSVATHALSIFCDHSDVMAARGTGFAMLAAGSVQEAQDFAALAQAATLRSRVPFLHFFDGFRTSHEIAKIAPLGDEDLLALLDEHDIRTHRRRALTPDHPVLRGTAQNPDVFFQAREACNLYYDACPGVVVDLMRRFASLTGRLYHPFDYVGHPQAERVVVLMGSGAETTHEVVEALVEQGERVGLIKVRLLRPFAPELFLGALPESVTRLAVLDRTKEPGAVGEPLYLDVLAALAEAGGLEGSGRRLPTVIGGRYGLSSKEFDPACVQAVFEELARDQPRRRFTVGIVDDVTHLSLPRDPGFTTESAETVRAIFYGLGSDGSVGANKSSIKIIGEETDHHAQGYFVYDSKKAGAVTISHLRFGPQPIRSAYLISQASFIACHQFHLLERHDVLASAAPGAVFLLNAPYPPERIWGHLPQEIRQAIEDRALRFFLIDAYAVAREAGLGGRINTIMQTCFFAISGVLPRDRAVSCIRRSIERTYGKRGAAVVEQNFRAVDAALAHLYALDLASIRGSEESPGPPRARAPLVPHEAPDFVQRVTAVMLAGKGDALPVSAFPPDGTWPTGTSRWEKRAIALEVPIWDPEVCIQCNQCAFVCPHAAIRAKVYAPAALDGAPAGFLHHPYQAADHRGLAYTLQVAPEDCTGCHLCVEVCPARDRARPRHKAINMVPLEGVLERERESYRFFLDLPQIDRTEIERIDGKGSQFFEPLFEYSGACAGCGETPYIKLLTQLFGDRLMIANATGCSSIYGGNLPTTPYTTNAEGRGPAWSNSLFEDNAEFGLGFRLSVDNLAAEAGSLLRRLAPRLGREVTGWTDGLVDEILGAEQGSEAGIAAQRRRVAQLQEALDGLDAELEGSAARDLHRLEIIAPYLVDKSIWLVGGDGWAYDIGYGGLDHVLALGRKVNVLVLDTEVYSNTGGQQSKATPLGAAAKFASAGKATAKKDLGREAMAYDHVYVAQVAFGAKWNQTVEAFREADAFPGPSLIIAHSPCIAHGYDLRHGASQQRKAVETWVWPLYRRDPRRVADGKPALRLDSSPPRGRVADYMRAEARFRMVEKQSPERFRYFVAESERAAQRRYELYRQLAGITVDAHHDPKQSGEE